MKRIEIVKIDQYINQKTYYVAILNELTLNFEKTGFYLSYIITNEGLTKKQALKIKKELLNNLKGF